MVNDRQYVLELGLNNEADIEEVEDYLQDILLDLYDAGGVEEIKVIDKNGGVPNDDNFDEFIDNLDGIDSRDIRRSIDFVKRMEDDDE